MKASENRHIKNPNTISLKDGRELYTTNNGFKYWVVSKKGKVDEITEAQYNKAKVHRITKKNR